MRDFDICLSILVCIYVLIGPYSKFKFIHVQAIMAKLEGMGKHLLNQLKGGLIYNRIHDTLLPSVKLTTLFWAPH